MPWPKQPRDKNRVRPADLITCRSKCPKCGDDCQKPPTNHKEHSHFLVFMDQDLIHSWVTVSHAIR